jgi:lipopolysaccharide export system protein LptC
MRFQRTKKYLGLVFLLLIIAVFTYLAVPHTLSLKFLKERNVTPNWFMKNVQTRSYTVDGKLKNVLSSPKVQHVEKGNIIELSKPTMVSHTNKGNVWRISAEHGKAAEGSHSKVYLWGNVQIKELPGKGSNQTHLITSYLIYNPKTSTAHTNKKVTIMQPNSIMHSTGFTANLKTGVIHFLSRTSSEFDDAKKK